MPPRFAQRGAGFRPDIVHAHNVKAAVIARAGVHRVLRRRASLLATFHGVLPDEYRRAARLLRGADHLACVSTDLRSAIVAAGFPPSRANVLRNAVTPHPPIDAEYRARLDRELEIGGAPLVAIVGRLVPQKAHHRFVRAARMVAEQTPEVRFAIVGDGPLRSQIEAEVSAAGIAANVRFTGVRPDARAIIARGGPGRVHIGLGGTLDRCTGGAAAGTPIVTTDVQGMHELLDGGAGVVVSKDDGASLATAILKLLADDRGLAAMGHAGRTLIDSEFSVNRMLDGYLRLYGELISAHS